MKLEGTVALMNSENYKDRFVAEYCQTKIRYEKLKDTLNKIETGKLSFEPNTPLHTLSNQQRCMGEYLHFLELRAEYEGIELPNPWIGRIFTATCLEYEDGKTEG